MRTKINHEDRRKEVPETGYEMFKAGLFNTKIPHNYNFAVGYAIPPSQSKFYTGNLSEKEIRMARVNNKLVMYE